MMIQDISHHMTELPHTIRKEAPIRKARELMSEFSYHHLPVLDGGHVVGVITERDLRVAEALYQENETTVAQIMNEDLLFVERNTPLKEVLKTMLNKRSSSVLVRGTKDKPWGVFTTTDALRLLMVMTD